MIKNPNKPSAPLGECKNASSASLFTQMNQISQSTKNIFTSLDVKGTLSVSSKFFLAFLQRNGLSKDDPRLKSLFAHLQELDAIDNDVQLTLMDFDTAISTCRVLIHKVVAGELRVPSFHVVFREVFTKIYHQIKNGENDGTVACYIPQLACVDPELFGISVTTVDGQHFSIGDAEVPFCHQSCAKPIGYLMALELFGSEKVHNHVGTEPSGHRFNEMTLKDAPVKERPQRQIPHNPMINAGAIVVTSMVHPELAMSGRLAKILDITTRLSAPDVNEVTSWDRPTYSSEVLTADRNRCLAYMMKERHSFPEELFDYRDPDSVNNTLDLYFKMCSITTTSKLSSIMAATFANGGLNPLTGDRVVSPRFVRDVLPLMFSCGMYDYSGQWAYEIGIPAKSGVSGSVILVIPNVCGICIYSPRLDGQGNSFRGVEVAKLLVKHFSFHNFEVFSGLSRRTIDPTLHQHATIYKELSQIMFAAAEGDLNELTTQNQTGADLYVADYDGRTSLHLAAAEGHVEVLRFLIESAPPERRAEIICRKDRYGATPLDSAEWHDHHQCFELLYKSGADRGKSGGGSQCIPTKQPPLSSACSENLDYDPDEIAIDPATIGREASRILYAASEGDLHELIKIRASGVDLRVLDYDRRSALHLAACNNHLHIIEYLKSAISRCYDWHEFANTKDRWNATPLDDAIREGHEEVERFLRDEVSDVSDLEQD